MQSSPLSVVAIAVTFLAVANGQGVIKSAVGDKGTSFGLQVDLTNQADANYISTAELNANVVNECGRTLLGGNIDIGEKTEAALSAGSVTQVKSGSTLTMTIQQLNANGTGPYTCDMDPTSNAAGITGQTALTVTQGTSTDTTGDLTIKVAMPANYTCVGASTGNICTVRCRNAANFGGCVAVQQTDVIAKANTPSNIPTAQTLAGINSQIQQNLKDLPAAMKAIGEAATMDEQGLKLAQDILAADPVVESAAAAAAPTTTKKGKKVRATQAA